MTSNKAILLILLLIFSSLVFGQTEYKVFRYANDSIASEGTMQSGEDGIYYEDWGDYCVAVVSGDNQYTGDVTIPETVTYDGTTYSVNWIGDESFDARGPIL